MGKVHAHKPGGAPTRPEKVKKKMGRPRKIERIVLNAPPELPPALPASLSLAMVPATAAPELKGWIDGWIAASPIEDQEARRTLATGLAICRRFADETARIQAPLHMALSDGQARLLTQALKMLPIYAEKLGVTAIDKERRKQNRQKQKSPKSLAPPAGRVTDVEPEGYAQLVMDIEGKAPWEEE